MEKILVLDFGGQYDQLIARRIREQHVYAEIRSYNMITLEEIEETGYSGIIFTGGPNSVYDESSPHFDSDILNLGIPVLGICYGDQLIAWMAGGKVSSAGNSSEYGRSDLFVESNEIFAGVAERSVCWMSHTDYISEVPDGFMNIAHTEKCPCAAMYDGKRRIYGVQFHPEVTHTEYGNAILHNFLFAICGCHGQWEMESFIENSVSRYREELKDRRVLLALSGGVDSSVAAVLLNKAIGKNLVCVFVDHGLLRKDEGDKVERVFREQFDLNLIRVNAQQ
ncbi:MAG: glutamine-hydrolyzing GMP synthase, partial [Erysipelotrichaceae bacterium]|nr:glutamine-hydrolyzing GMP synthase [Erysipelotrichaceae bacterium]